MPPYAGDSIAFSSSNAYADVAPTKTESGADDASATDNSEKGGRFDALFDFNPCVSMSSPGHSMSSAMFKVRNCSHCGKGCNKLKGYKKEVIEGTAINEETGEEEPANQKIYFHKWCFQLKEWKEVHSEGWKKVMDGLIGHFRAIELAEQRRRESEEQARRESMRRAEEARRAAEEKRRQEEEQRRLEEEERVAREMAEEQARLKKEASFTYKIGKKLSAFKKAVSSPCMNNKAVDESATAPEQYPSHDL